MKSSSAKHLAGSPVARLISKPRTMINLARLYQKFNARYFNGALQDRAILLGFSRSLRVGYYDRHERRIILDVRLLQFPSTLKKVLLHEMVHAAASPYHGLKFRRQLYACRKQGAPILRDCPARLREIVIGDLL